MSKKLITNSGLSGATLLSYIYTSHLHSFPFKNFKNFSFFSTSIYIPVYQHIIPHMKKIYLEILNEQINYRSRCFNSEIENERDVEQLKHIPYIHEREHE
jgi:hypothetical protein